MIIIAIHEKRVAEAVLTLESIEKKLKYFIDEYERKKKKKKKTVISKEVLEVVENVEFPDNFLAAVADICNSAVYPDPSFVLSETNMFDSDEIIGQMLPIESNLEQLSMPQLQTFINTSLLSLQVGRGSKLRRSLARWFKT